jgi:hypothetical protein
MPRTLDRAKFDALLARPLHSITVDKLRFDVLTVDYIRELLDKYNVDYDSNLTKKPLHEKLMIRHTNVVDARATDEEEQATPMESTAINIGGVTIDTYMHDLEQRIQERLAALTKSFEDDKLLSQQRVSAFTNSFKEEITNVHEEMIRKINTVDGNCMTRNNNVRAVAREVFCDEVTQLQLPTNQMVLDTITTATTPINTNISLLDTAIRQHDETLAKIVHTLDQRFPQPQPWSGLGNPVTYRLLPPATPVLPGGAPDGSSTGGTETTVPHGGVSLGIGNTGNTSGVAASPHAGNSGGTTGGTPGAVFPNIDPATGQRIPNQSTPTRLTNPYSPAVRRHWSPMNETDPNRSSFHSL